MRKSRKRVDVGKPLRKSTVVSTSFCILIPALCAVKIMDAENLHITKLLRNTWKMGAK